ncbi:MAG: Maf family nucleotide pyrophosphatase [Halothiobacillaceae bacterium]|nr:Maf family nucleotide pyrophosphatase [Halothiobacillaceae bacterium]
MSQPTLILASTSPYRRALLERLRLPFSVCKPGVDEARLPNESAEQMVCRLAQAKAAVVAREHSAAWVIGSDQCAVLGEQILGKPGTHARAVEQLEAASGKRVTFHTGLCLMQHTSSFERVVNIPFSVHFRELSAREIEHYLQREQPYDCAGSFKSEGLGITLFQAMQGDDPSSLIGLPLIALCSMLREAGLDPLT